LLWVGANGRTVESSFAEIAAQSKRVANVLTRAGVGRGETVIVILTAPGTTQLSAKDIANRINAARTAGVVTDIAGAEKLDQVA